MNLIAVTNRALCKNQQDFLDRFAALCGCLGEGDAILLREKDLAPQSYAALAIQCAALWKGSSCKLILHSHDAIARSLGVTHLHVPFPLLQKGLPKGLTCSTSVHSVEEAVMAQQLGASYLIAGHIFPTDCKKCVPPKGLDFLQTVCEKVDIPVYAIGGITPDRVPAVQSAGAAGVCVMSRLMTCEDMKATVQAFHTP